MPVLPAHHRPVGPSAVACGPFLYADLAGRGGRRLWRLAYTELANMCISSSARAWQPSRPESAIWPSLKRIKTLVRCFQRDHL